MKYGIDISHHNKITNWTEIKNYCDFIIIRAGYGKSASQVDKNFYENYRQCKIHNIPVGVYWYSYALNTADALLESNVCYDIIKSLDFELPVFYDVEDETQKNKNCVDIINTFCGNLRKKNIKNIGWYSCESFINSYIDESKISTDFYKWIANCTKTDDNYINSKNAAIHQYSFTGTINGNSCKFDLDKMNDKTFYNFVNIRPETPIEKFIRENDITANDALKILQAVVNKK